MKLRARPLLLAVGLVVLAIGLARFAPRASLPSGDVADLAELSRRGDLNVLFILVDTLRADRLGSYGYARDTSPTLDALARDGVRFADVRAQSSWTKCSMASLWTGLHPVSTGVLKSLDGLAEEAVLPAEILREAGFRTAGIWRNGWLDPRFGFGQGFDLYLRPTAGRQPGADGRPGPRVPGSDRDIVRSAAEFLRGARHDRWFLYLHLMDVHQYASDEASARFGTSYSDIYDNAIHWVDRNVAAVLAELETLGLRDRTLIVLASDHGEAFDEHGREGHARDIHSEVTTTPLILGLPFRLDPGWVVEAPVANVDLWPTVLDLLGLPELPEPHGRSLVPAIRMAARGERESDPPETYAQLDASWGRAEAKPDPMISVRRGDHRMIYRPAEPEASVLYDLRADPREQVNRVDELAEVAAGLRATAEAYTRRAVPWGEVPAVEVDADEMERLRALGYEVGP